MTDVQDPLQPTGFRFRPQKPVDPLADPRRQNQGIGLRQPIMTMDKRTHRLLVAVPNDGPGNDFLTGLRREQAALGFHFAGTLGEILKQLFVERSEYADEMTDKFAFLDILPGFDLAVLSGILRHGCAKKLPNDTFSNIDVEPDQQMRYRGTGLGPNFQLTSKHGDFLTLLNAAAAASKGKGVVIAVVDSGVERSQIVDGFFDLVEPLNNSEKDNFGHGTAMGTIIKDTASDADVYAIRMSNQDPDISEAMLGISCGSFHFKADVINLSFGLPEGITCSHCGAQPSVSKVLKRFLQNLSEKPMAASGEPLLVAATGNDGHSTGFDSPARWDFAVAVGSINQSKFRSSFSNYGTTPHAHYFMMPGGEEQQGTPSEWVGEATEKCFGTSVSAAYASAVLALYMSDPKYQNPDRAAFLTDVLQQCQPCTNQNTVEHGAGYLPYTPRP